MNGKDFNEVIRLIVRNDPRYDRGAYDFVRKALDHTLKKIRESKQERRNNHVSGQELLEGIREFALEQYGPMAYTLFREWGLRRTADFGEIVFNLVDYGVFGKTERDDRADFADVYDFQNAFVAPYEPRAASTGQGTKTGSNRTRSNSTPK